MKRLVIAAAIFVATTVSGPAIAGLKSASISASGRSATHTVQMPGLTPKQRGNIARALVQQWAPEVRRQGGDVGQWAVKMGRFVGTADASNVRQALDMPTYQTMMGVLQGQPVASKSIQAALAQTAEVGIESLGSTISDTTYTPLPNGRCRIADSRVIASPLPGGVTRAIDSEGVGSYANQGGNGTFANGDGSANCGLPDITTAVAVSVTVLSNGADGFFKIYENGKPFQTGSTVYYTSTVSAANDMIVTSCQSCALELSIYSSSSVQYVIDIVGYFAPPFATGLQCVGTANTTVSVPVGGAAVTATAPACPTGYTQTGTNCETTSDDVGIVYMNNGNCRARSASLVPNDVRASRTCCRVPGR